MSRVVKQTIRIPKYSEWCVPVSMILFLLSTVNTSYPNSTSQQLNIVRNPGLSADCWKDEQDREPRIYTQSLVLAHDRDSTLKSQRA